MNIKVSVIVPAFNCEKTIEKCINSIINQTLKELEIIIVNDGSTDKTYNVIKKVGNKDSRITIINKVNEGPSKARNSGIKIARGEYIGFVDSDDYVDKDMFYQLYLLANKYNSEICGCNYYEEGCDGKVLNEIQSNLPYEQVLSKKMIRNMIIKSFVEDKNSGFYSLWNKIYKKKFLYDYSLFLDESRSHGEDWLFNINAFNYANNVIFLGKTLYHYVQINEFSLMRTYRTNQIDLLFSGRKALIHVLKENDISIDDSIFNNKFIYTFYSYVIKEIINNHNDYKEKIMNYLKNDYLNNIVHNVSNLPTHLKIMICFIKYKRYNILILYLELLAKISRIKNK